jgi:hypothetical protein
MNDESFKNLTLAIDPGHQSTDQQVVVPSAAAVAAAVLFVAVIIENY